MSSAAWVITIGFAAFAAAVGFVLELFNNDRRSEGHPVTVALISAVVMFFLNWSIVYFGMPYFTWWSIDGGPILFFLALLVPIIMSALVGTMSDSLAGAGVGTLVFIVLFVIWGLVILFTPPIPCDNPSLKRLAGQLKLQDATTAYPEVDLNDIIRVPESVAMAKAGNILSNTGQGASLGSYLAPNRAYIQIIQGKPYYVIDLAVTSWRAFQTQGGVIPGYILVDAVDPTPDAVLQTGYPMRFAPRAMWYNDLDRRVYMDFLLGTPNRVEDLDGMEVDDNFVPHYVGTLEQHQIGYKGMGITGLYDFDPQTGAGKQLALSEKPTWLERVYPVEWFTKYAEYWGQYHIYDVCKWQGSFGQEMVDRTSVVAVHGGLEYQITMTSVGNDPSLTHLITVDPTTGVSTLYPFRGITMEATESDVAAASKKLNPAGYKAEGCQILRLLNRDTVYCMLTYTDTATASMQAQNHVVLGGYAFADMQAIAAGNLESIAVGKTFDDAYANYQQIIASTGIQSSLANTQEDVQIAGVVLDNQQVDYPNAQSRSFLITVQKDDGTIAYLLAPANMLNAAIATSGKRVTATCYQQPNQKYLNVRHINVEGAPDLGGALYVKFDTLINWIRANWPFGK